MMDFLKNIALNCEQATQLAEKKRENKLSWSEGLGLRIHLGYCSLCRLFIAQSELLAKAAKLFSQRLESEQSLFSMDSARKNEITQEVERELKND